MYQRLMLVSINTVKYIDKSKDQNKIDIAKNRNGYFLNQIEIKTIDTIALAGIAQIKLSQVNFHLWGKQIKHIVAIK